MVKPRTVLAILRIVGKLPAGHKARAVFFRIAGSPRGVCSADDVSEILSALRTV